MKTIGHPGDSHHCSRGCYKTLLELRSPGTEWQSSHHLILGRLAFRWPIPLIPLFPLYWSRALCGSFWGRGFFFFLWTNNFYSSGIAKQFKNLLLLNSKAQAVICKGASKGLWDARERVAHGVQVVGSRAGWSTWLLLLASCFKDKSYEGV